MKEIDRLLGIVDRLRGPGGCPWDRAQTLETLQPCLTDEAYEVISAINSLQGENLVEELGDLLFHVLMLCRVAEVEGGVTLAGICRGIEEKMVRRHPHVFGDVKVEGAEEAVRNWEEIKAREKEAPLPASLYEDSFKHLPALRRAQRIQKKAEKVGFDWEDVSGVVAKIREELAEVEAEIAAGDRKRLEREIGDLFFSVVNLSRFLGFDAEKALQGMANRWVRRFKRMESALKGKGRFLELKEVPFGEMDALWEKIAESEKKEGGRDGG